MIVRLRRIKEIYAEIKGAVNDLVDVVLALFPPVIASTKCPCSDTKNTNVQIRFSEFSMLHLVLPRVKFDFKHENSQNNVMAIT